MSQFTNELVARAERERVRWISDEQLELAVAIGREFLPLEEEFIELVTSVLVGLPGGLHGEPVEPAVRAILYLARHGIPHGLPTAD